MKEIEIKHVYKHYPIGNKEKFTALTDINVSFKKGELVSIVGESGSGKSTLMNLIGGLDSQFEGDIFVEGVNLRGQPDKMLDRYRKNKVGFVFQSFNLIPHLSILDNVTVALTLSNVSPEEKVQKATAILTRLGLENQLKRKPNQLSGGQKQRVAIARALINDPDIILADEPTGALDTGTSAQILEIMKEIADEGKLVIMVTHSEKIASVSSRVVELSDGRIIRDEKNKKYKKNKKISIPKIEKSVKSENQKLSIRSAVRLAFHNMWASKTKNFLMSFGVAISIVALIIMLAFGSGLDQYIADVSHSFTNPNIVTISKQGDDLIGAFIHDPFTEEETQNLITELNTALEENGYEYRVTEEELLPGFSSITGMGITVNFNFPEGTEILPGEDGSEQTGETEVSYIYTTPPYYTDVNLIEGTLSGENEVMLTPAAYSIFNQLLGTEDVIGQKIILTVQMSGLDQPFTQEVTITGVIDTSVIQSVLAMYVDFDFLKSVAVANGLDPAAFPITTYYIDTDETTAAFLNDYIMSSSNYSGSIEEGLTSMFSEMSNTISIALTIIACISLIVSAIMILVVLYISVSERTKEIGVLKSIGARRKDIRLIFTSESFLIGLLSGIVGIILALGVYGIFIAVLTSLLGFAPLSLKWYYFLIAIGVSVAVSMLSGLYPSNKAAKLDPVESLRRE